MNSGSVYIITNKNRTTLYIGVTNDLERRMLEHKCSSGSKFATKYNLVDLLYFEHFDSIIEAISYEKQLKNWRREWKLNLIKEENPVLLDLASDWFTVNEILEHKNYLKGEALGGIGS